MRVKALPVLIASLALFAPATHAQTSVVLYGAIDNNIEYVSNLGTQAPSAANGFNAGPGGNAVRLTSGALSGSRFGLRGTEDLGSGMKALFVLENGFGSDDGKLQQGGRIFGRQAYLGLDHASFGRVTFGRQYSTMFSALANFSPTAYASQYEPLVAQLGLDARSDNTVKYSGTFGPVGAIAHWSFGTGVTGNGEVPGQFRRDTGYGTGLTYASGPVGAAVVYSQFNPTLNAAGATGTFKKAAVAASYAVGNAKIMGGYRWGQNKAPDSSLLLRDDYYWAGLVYQLSAPLALTVAYYYDDVKKLAGTNIKNPWQVLFVADYSLSKRTDLYLSTAYVRNSGLNFDTSAISFANGYFLGAGKDNMVGVALGIRHIF
ncbi:porin [Cupriavidus numazuensis]|uniref:Outer membrane porin protein n=1 Tax=Cupriavidus numazuensis TaxID=221992 RepID=A0ABN7Q9P0_9BURK|nr:porin [Cupriavidus numazuensis]CAG2158165.1 Outer membrane porin protein [Cupriavidus numazuensis]